MVTGHGHSASNSRCIGVRQVFRQTACGPWIRCLVLRRCDRSASVSGNDRAALVVIAWHNCRSGFYGLAGLSVRHLLACSIMISMGLSSYQISSLVCQCARTTCRCRSDKAQTSIMFWRSAVAEPSKRRLEACRKKARLPIRQAGSVPTAQLAPQTAGNRSRCDQILSWQRQKTAAKCGVERRGMVSDSTKLAARTSARGADAFCGKRKKVRERKASKRPHRIG